MKNYYYKLLIKVINYTFIGMFCQLFLAGLCIASHADAQKAKSIKEVAIEANYIATSLEDIFRDIESQTDFVFTYDKKDDFLAERYTNNNGKIIVAELFKDLSSRKYLIFQQINNNISVREKINEREKSPEPIIDFLEVSGIVTSVEGEALPGVNILVKGTSIGAVTDIDGKFSINVPDANSILVFSFIGFTPQEVPVGGRSVINITLQEDVQSLNEVVVIGYGTAKRKDLTGAISSISAEQLEKQPSANLTQALRGSVPGLDVGLNTSAKGIGNLLVRGKTSLKANNAPLIVVDGVIYYGDLADINTADVESIDVLKDASSAAVYGSRAASGVIIITTKSGGGEPQINFNVSTGFSHLKDRTERVDAETYLQRRSDYWEYTNTNRPAGYYRNPNSLPDGVTLNDWRNYDSGIDDFSNEEIYFSRNELNSIELENYLAGREVDWYDEIYRTGLRQDYNVSINGASDKISYYYSLGYLNNEGFYVDEKFKNIRTRLKLESEVTDFITVGVNAQYANRDESPQYPNYNLGVNMSPLGSMYHEDGTLRFLPHNDNAVQNPLYYRYSDNFAKDNDIMGNIYASVELPLGFTYRVNWINQLQWDSDYHFDYSTAEKTGEGARRRNSHYNQWFLDNILSWNKTFGDHHFDFTFLYNLEKTSFWSTTAENSVFEPDELLGYHQLNHGTIPVVGANDWISTAAALMARMNYTLRDKYMITASFRRDGYSAFGIKNPYANFPSLAIAWRLSDESFFDVNGIDFLKLRLSYGVNGNRDVSTYAALQHLGSVKYIYNVNGGHQSVTGFQPTRMANPDLMWEETAAWNAGIDFAIFNGKLSGALEAYSMLTSNLILDRSLPSMTGYLNITSNLGAVSNKGLELSLTSNNVNNTNFSWSSQAIFSLNRNEIKELYGDMTDILDENGNVIGQEEADDFTNNWFIGEDIDRIYNYELDGVWQEDQEDEAGNYGLNPGDFRVVDQNDDGVISPREDKVFLGYSTPRYKISLINNLTLFKNFDVSFLLNMQLDWEGANNNHFHSGWQYGRMGRYNYPYWTPDNPTNEWGKQGSNNPYGASYYLSRSFIRLQNISVGYRVPGSVIEKFNVEALKLSVDLQNPWVSSPWDLWDPETVLPTPMIGTFNVRLTL